MREGAGGCWPGRTDAVEKGRGRDAAALGILSAAVAAAATAAAVAVEIYIQHLRLLFERRGGKDSGESRCTLAERCIRW